MAPPVQTKPQTESPDLHFHRNVDRVRIPRPRLLLWIVAIIVAATVIYSLPKRGSQLNATHFYPNYKLARCDAGHIKSVDLGRRTDVYQVELQLHEGGYCTHVVLPPMCTFGAGCFFQKSQNPGDYATVWCNGDRYPKPIRPEEVSYMSDPNPAAFNRGGDFYGCMQAGESTIDFYVQGHGTLWITKN